ncbi:unnamed protein product [Coffea canephora]|uniref:DH200=94 genomic scaffold, scaffold_469 n=1 Tax=Coffea canephora TaxID=49390 RepID=A0A068VIA4_COFCA|nr:unnamed protein product [Coffea canephora]
MALTILSSVLNQLSILLREEGQLLGGLRQEVELIRDELGRMRAFLRVAETKEEDADPGLQEWIKQVREAAYDIEDVLDEFVSRFARHRATGFHGFVRKIFNSIKTLRARHKVAEQIQSIKARVKFISEGHRRYQLEFGVTTQTAESLATVNNTTWRYSRDDALLVEEAELIGIDNPRQQLISQLLQGDDSQLKVVSVVGMGGLGKTTLVKILKQFVKDFLQQAGRYAIVFDDVWDVKFWNAIRIALPKNGYGNRVMLTTRQADVAFASCTQSQDYVFKMEFLSFEDSWTLFCNKIFKGNGCPAHLIDVAKGILGKCEGLPLAILAISGLWALKDFSIAEWEMVRHSLGGELEGSGMLDRVRKILLLSYNDLPCDLKTCLLYLSIYPEGFKIRCHRLVQLWSAEGFVGKTEGMTMKDVGFSYLTELVNRSLIQVTQSFYEGIPYTCRIHDLVREVVLSKSREQNMIAIANEQCTRWFSEKVRRLIVHSSSNNTEQHQESQCYSFNHLRSFITIESMNPPISRALTGVKAVPKFIGKLRNLEYLDLGETQVKELPMEIQKLKKLEHLIVHQKVDFSEARLLALQSLTTIDASSGSVIVKEIGTLTQLSRLGISNLRREDGKVLCSSLATLTSLQLLDIASIRNEEKMPQWIARLQSLVRIDLDWSGLTDEEDPLEPLHHLPNLVTIQFCGSYQGEGLCFKTGGFLKLKDLYLKKLEKLKWLNVEEGALASLHELCLDRLPLLEELPLDIQHLSQLRKLGLHELSSQLMEKLNSLNEDSEDYRKIGHIPEVEIVFLTNEGWKYRLLWGKKM